MISTDEFGNFYQSVEMEQCVFGKSVVEIPQEFCEKVDLFSEVLNFETWEKVLNDEQRNHLMKFLPTFHENDEEEKNTTIRNLFTGENFRFGNPVHQFHRRLKDGYYSPETVRGTALLRKAIYREYRYQQQRYFYKLLQDILISRKKLLEAASKLPPDQPVRMERIQPRYGNNSVDQRTKRRYFRELQEVREEVSYLETSSEDENYPEGSPPKMTKRQKKQLFHLEAALSPDMARVTSTLHPKCNNTDNGNNSVPSMRSVSPFEVSEEDYREMLLRHKRRRAEIEEHPELDTEGISLQDVVLRTNMTKRSAPRPVSAAELSSKKKCKDKEKIQNKKKKVKPPSSPVLLDEITKQVELDIEGTTPLIDVKDIKIEMDLIKEEDGNSLPPRSSTPNLLQDTFLSFFSLIRDLFCRSPEQRMSTQKLEDEVRAWQEGPFGGLNEWYMLQVNWPDQVFSALKFLAGELPGIMVENFVPYIDYKEKCQMWQWIGAGRDSDENMAALCKAWLDNKDDIPITETLDMVPGSPPPPRIHTEWVVRPTTEEEKAIYREQERRRYEMPHRAFTFRMHNYESVVGPVKGVYGKESAVNKAREHSLLVSDRPSFVTILSLVRDSAARLPNGEGTRADICELLKDSQYLAPASDSQIHTVVSGALDRLHYEKDPCVKYDVNRKLWIYLHRNRTEEEFERIHQAHAAAAKAKKADKKTKVPRSKSKEVPRPVASQSPASSDSALSLDMTGITGGSTSAVSPATAQSPRGGSSPRAQQTSPKVSASASKIMSSAQNNTKIHVTSTGTSFMPPSNSKTATASITTAQITQRLTNSALLTSSQALSRPPSTESVPSPQLSTTAPFVLPQSHAGSRPSSTGSAQSLPSPKAVIANVNAAQFVSVSQVQITPGTVSPKTVISPSTHTSQAKTVSNLLNQQQAFQQIVAKQQAINKPTVAVVTSPSIAQSVSTVKLLPSQSVILGKPGTNPLVSQPIGQPTLQGLQTIMIKQEPGTQMVTTQSGGTSSPKTVLTPGSKPVVARIISNPQVVSVGNLINTLTQKQGTALPGATTFKIQGGNIVRPMGGKPGQMNVIQTTPGAGGLSRLAVVSQGGTGNLIPVSCATVSAQPKLVAASGQIGVMHSHQQAQLSATSKSAILTTPGGMKIISTSATSPGVNLAQLGKPGQTVVVTTKPATPTSVAVATTTAAQNVILTSGGQTSPAVVIATQGALKPAQTVVMAAAGTAQTVVMAAQPGIRPITATAVTPMNMKALQGVKVIPVSQGAGAKGKAQPVFARIITPPAGLTLRPTGAVTTAQQGISVIQSVAAIPSGTAAATVRSGAPGMTTSIPSTQAAIIRLQTPSNTTHIDMPKENT